MFKYFIKIGEIFFQHTFLRKHIWRLVDMLMDKIVFGRKFMNKKLGINNEPQFDVCYGKAM